MTWHAYKRVLISDCASCRCSNEVEALLVVSSIVVFVTVYALLSRLLPGTMYIRSASSPSTVLWAFHTIQPSSCHCLSLLSRLLPYHVVVRFFARRTVG